MKSGAYLLAEGFRNLWKNRTMSLASVAVLISCLLLTGVAILLSINMDSIMKDIEGSNNITIYIDDEVPTLTSIQIGETIRSMSNIATCEYITSSDALAYVSDDIGIDATLFEGLGDFMPDAFNISMIDLSLYDETITAITAIEGVEKYSDYSDVAEKLLDLDILIRYASIAVVAILAIISLFIISNTVKVTMFSRRVEIKIMKSVGATNTFIRIPFFVEGMLIGLISGTVSATILFFSYEKVTEVIYSIVPFINVIDINPYFRELYIVYAIAGALFGILGGVVPITKYLKRDGEEAV